MDWRERTTAAALLLRGENSCMWTREVRNSCRTAACMEVVVMDGRENAAARCCDGLVRENCSLLYGGDRRAAWPPYVETAGGSDGREGKSSGGDAC